MEEAGEREGGKMTDGGTLQVQRDALAIEITRELIRLEPARRPDSKTLIDILREVYALTDAALTYRNVSRPNITKCE